MRPQGLLRMTVTMETVLQILALLNLIGITFPAAVPPRIPQFLTDRLHISPKEYNYLVHNGFLRPKDYQFTFEPEEDITTVSDAITRFQEFYRIPMNGEMDDRTRSMMWEPRCGYPDIGEAIHNESNNADYARKWRHRRHHRVRRYDIAGGRYKWDSTHITYSIVNYPTRGQIKPWELRNTIKRAFRVWSDVTPLEFTEFTGHRVNEAMIRIAFLKGRHSHDLEHPIFDGPDGDLAHAFSPKSGWGEVNGDIHFDDDDLFTMDDDDRGYNFFQTAAHEIGHALGLDHSDDPGALMWPHYHFMRDFRLPKDDILGIQALYGPEGSTPSVVKNAVETRPKLAPTVPSRKSYCQAGFSAVTSISGSIYTFKGKNYWRSWRRLLVTPKDGRKIYDKWYNLPANIRAVYHRRDDRTVFFRGSKYWVYFGSRMEEGYPRPVDELGLPKGVDAALSKTKAKTFFFKGNQVWRFDEKKQAVDRGYPKMIEEVFKGIGNKVTAAFRHDDGNSYLLRGKKYYLVAKGKYEAEPGYPRKFTTDFLGCAPLTE
ncbi:interstitial collagenase-like isoform X1 [Diadema antillarum]|uniref:interstitial collagenase-like isoform X1 n=1 Tax=Diadema antillarum TaxID=105358 RepID=UPI003A85C2EA